LNFPWKKSSSGKVAATPTMLVATPTAATLIPVFSQESGSNEPPVSDARREPVGRHTK
jgi:hypothetical protein